MDLWFWIAMALLTALVGACTAALIRRPAGWRIDPATHEWERLDGFVVYRSMLYPRCWRIEPPHDLPITNWDGPILHADYDTAADAMAAVDLNWPLYDKDAHVF